MTIETGETSNAYFLSEYSLDGQAFNIDAKHYKELDQALTTVACALEIEESFQVFAQSILRFEKDLLDVAFNYASLISSGLDDEFFLRNTRNRFNINILTTLTSFRSYDDHCDRILECSIIAPETQEFNCRLKEKVFDVHLSYRICNFLRNYAQHRALPLGGFNLNSGGSIGRDDAGNPIKYQSGYNVSPWLNVSKFKSSSKYKGRLRKELENLGYEKIDMTWLIRSFAEAMYARHAALRAHLKPKVIAAGEKIAAGYAFASHAKNSEATHLELNGDNKKRPMRNDLSAITLRNFETYTWLGSAVSTYVTSQPTPETTIYRGQVSA